MSWSAEVVDAWPPPPDVLAAWDALALARSSVFMTPAWTEAWLEAAPAHRPHVVVARRPDGSVGGVVPLVAHGPARAQTLEPPGGRLVDLSEALCAPGDEDAVAAAVAGALAAARRWTVARLDRVADPAWPGRLVRAFPARGAVALRHKAAEPLPYAVVRRDEAGTAAPLLSGKHRRELGRMRRRLAEAHVVTAGRAGTPGEVEATLDRVIALWEESWGPMPPVFARHHRAFARRAHARGWLRLTWIALDGEVVAGTNGWRFGDRAFVYQIVSAASHQRAGVGVLALDDAVAAAVDEGIVTYEFLRGEGLHKRRYATGTRRVDSWYVTRRGHPARAGLAAFSVAKARVRELPDERRAQLHRLAGL